MFLDFLSFAEKMFWCLSKIGFLVFSQKCVKFMFDIFWFLSSIAEVNWWYYRENEFNKVFPSSHEEILLKMIKFYLLAIYFVIHWQYQNQCFHNSIASI